MCVCEGSRPGAPGCSTDCKVKSVKPSQNGQRQSKTVKILLNGHSLSRVSFRSLLATARSRAPDTSCSTSALRGPALTAVKTLKDQSKTVKILLNTSQIRSKIQSFKIVVSSCIKNAASKTRRRGRLSYHTEIQRSGVRLSEKQLFRSTRQN